MPPSASRNCSTRHAAGAHVFAEAPHVGAGADVLAAELAVEHRPAGDDERGQIAAGRAHHQRRRGLVAAAEQDDAVDRVAADRFLDVHAHEVAEQHRRRPQVRLAERGDGEFERQAAGFPDAALDVIGERPQMRVARRQLRPGVADADDGTAVEDIGREALIPHPAAVDESVFVLLTEPGGRAVGALSARTSQPRVSNSLVRASNLDGPAVQADSRSLKCRATK